MNLWLFWLVIISGFFAYVGGNPFIAPPGMLPYMAYFTSYYRGVCVAVMINRMAALTAAICVSNPLDRTHSKQNYDTRPINLILGSSYRHPRRGIKVQVTKIIIPKMPKNTPQHSYIIQTSVAIMLLKSKVPDALTEFPVRPALVDTLGGNNPNYHEECLTAGWHFFEREIDIVYPVQKFLLQRNLRGYFINAVKSEQWCQALLTKFQLALKNLKYDGHIDTNDLLCTKDPEDAAQPCHGMYGAPLICRGRVVALLTVPDAQWTNCTGESNIFTRLDNRFLKPYFQCTETLFQPGEFMDMAAIKQKVYDLPLDSKEVHYDKVVFDNSDTSDEYARG